MATRKRRKVVKFKQKKQFNIGALVFFVLFVYVAIVSFNYITKEHVGIYEVTEKKIADDNRITGLVLRNEKVVQADKDGYINYYIADQSKIAKKTTIYSLDTTGRLTELLKEMEKEATPSEMISSSDIRNNINSFRSSFSPVHYSEVNTFKYAIDDAVKENTTENVLKDLKKALKATGESDSYEMVKATESGILSYTVDDFENVTEDTFTAEQVDKKEAAKKQLRSVESVAIGDPVYRLVQDEKWSLILPLSDKQYQKLVEKDSISVYFIRDNVKANAAVTLLERENRHFAKLDFSKYVIRYLNDRYLEVELIMNSADGLKIPATSILKKDCYELPSSYITKGNSSKDDGVTLREYSKDGKVKYVFCAAAVVKEEDGNSYIDASLLEAGQTIYCGDTNETFVLAKKVAIEGVYNVNEGYCKFRRVEKIYENQEYCIVKKDTPFGLSVYDHIVINPKTIKNDDIIY